MKPSQIKALDKFTRLDELDDYNSKHTRKYYRKQANRFERHTNKQLDKIVIKRYNKDTKSYYLIPFENIKGRRSIIFYPDGKPKTVNSRYADFEAYREVL